MENNSFVNQSTQSKYTGPDDFSVFEAMPGNSILVNVDAPAYTILAVTQGTIERSGLGREQLVGRPFLEPFPANPSNPDDPNSAGQNIVLNSFEHVLSYKEPDQL